MMEELLGNSGQVFFGLTVCLMGFAAFMTGQAIAVTWKPAWHALVYSLLLGFADRFLAYALFGGHLLSLAAYLIDTATLAAITLLAWRLARARKMVSQYPWLYERAGLFSWRSRTPPAS
jgi:branched-chain amino acid transport system ATP-binding protein